MNNEIFQDKEKISYHLRLLEEAFEKIINKWNSSLLYSKIHNFINQKRDALIRQHEKEGCFCLSDIDWINNNIPPDFQESIIKLQKNNPYFNKKEFLNDNYNNIHPLNIGIKQKHQHKIKGYVKTEYIFRVIKFNRGYLSNVLIKALKETLENSSLFRASHMFDNIYLLPFIFTSILYNIKNFIIDFCYWIFGLKYFYVKQKGDNLRYFIHNFPKCIEDKSIYKLSKNIKQNKWLWLKEVNEKFKESELKKLRNFFTHPYNCYEISQTNQLLSNSNSWEFSFYDSIYASRAYIYKNKFIDWIGCISTIPEKINLFDVASKTLIECIEIINQLNNILIER